MLGVVVVGRVVVAAVVVVVRLDQGAELGDESDGCEFLH